MPNGIGDAVERLHERARTQRGADHAQSDSGHREPDHDAPPAGRAAAVGKKQQSKAEQPKARREAELLKQRRGPAPGQRIGRNEEHLFRVLIAEVGHAQGDSGQAEDPADRVLRHARRDHRADGRERQRGDHERQAAPAVERRPVGRGVLAGSDHEQDERADGEHHADTPDQSGQSARRHRVAFSQSETCAGCIVSATTARSSPLRLSSSTSSRRRAPKRSSVRAASYLRRKKRRSTAPWIRVRAGRNSAATASVEAATARPESSVSGAQQELKQQHAAEVDAGRGSPSAHRRRACG